MNLTASSISGEQAATAGFRHASPRALAAALHHSRQDTLAMFARYEQALRGQGMAVAYSGELNPPLWELGHVGWFQEYWLARFSQRTRGALANPDAARQPPRRANADALYDSSKVPHETRWQLPLPSADDTRADVAAILESSLALLPQADDADDNTLYFHRLCLAHEDMHHEASVYMAQALGIAVADPRWQAPTLPAPGPALRCDGGIQVLGNDPSTATGFNFDNELGTKSVPLSAFEIDCQVLRWRDFLPFVKDGGYTTDDCWADAAAAAWRQAQRTGSPRYLKRLDGVWQHWRHGQWQSLNLDEPARHLTAFEAQAWCRWAGRRLPTEAEWQYAATACPDRFHWGAVWEWTSSPFEPFDGFVAHPYRDYSAPWFDSRPVLRGASFATQPRMRHLHYRNYFTPERNDIFAGFRSCKA